MHNVTFGIVVGNRGFFPGHLARDGRVEILDILKREGYGTICLTPEDSRYGAVETLAEARGCADLFDKNRNQIDGILVTLPNFGDERNVANAIRMSGLNLPVLVHAFPDDLNQFQIGQRRDSFCGKFSVCSNLSQYGIKFSLTQSHTVSANSDEFLRELRDFSATCRVVRGLRNSRFGAIGTRPASFNSVRFSEKLLESGTISVEVVDLLDLLGRVEKTPDSDPSVHEKIEAISKYVNTSNVPAESVRKMARFGVTVERWIAENNLVGTAIQCWTALEQYFGVVPCTVMSMMSNSLLPAACEVDVVGAIAMYVLQLASLTPSALVDWNNNYDGDPNKCVVFHCSNLPKAFFPEIKMDTHAILGDFVPLQNTWGALLGKIKPGPVTFLRMSTDDTAGKLTAYLAEGDVTDDPAQTWGGVGVVRVPRLQRLLQYICRHNFEHHVSINLSHTAKSIAEGLRTYLGWDVYQHNEELEG